jgi:hypothetical protein
MTEFTIVAPGLELPRGRRFTYRPRIPIETGPLYLLSIGRLLTIGRYYRDAAGRDWIIQPGRLIRIADKPIIEIWGLIVLLDS